MLQKLLSFLPGRQDSKTLATELLDDVVSDRAALKRALESADAERSSASPEHSVSVEGWFLKSEDDLVVGLTIGSTCYQFKAPFRERLEPAAGGYRYRLDDFSLGIAGTSATPERAKVLWACQFHTIYQQLRRHASENPREWEAMTKIVDAQAYERTNPIRLRQVGWISRISEIDRQVTWVGDDIEESVPLELAPAEFAGYREGEWFEMIVERDPRSWKLQEIHYSTVIPEDGVLSQAELERIVRDIPGTSSMGTTLGKAAPEGRARRE